MEFRVLKYFLAIAREQSISGAAESLHISQPTLSRQIKDLENELGKILFTRGSHKITLTEEGMILRKRAEEMVELVQRTENEIALSVQGSAGDICIAAGETDGIRLIANLIKKLEEDYPLIKYQFVSGNGPFVMERLDKGLADFGLIFGEVDRDKYE
ncbi:MAG: LysR family transcriptional regulator, partial [Oscillospiraceae bacterium]|nr:LysR family transcriptional regulator [Oscillospiraceae bacterium]